MAEGVEVTVRSQLLKIVEDLQKIGEQGKQIGTVLQQATGDVGQEVQAQTGKVMTGMDALKKFGKNVADQLKRDFTSLASVASLAGGLKLGQQFSGTVKEAVNLSDTVRRLGSVFGIAQGQFSTFQTKMQRGLGEIGLSSDAAAKALEGLAETPVRGQENLIAYARTAGELASISKEKGNEGGIAKGVAGIITARGGNVNDLGQMQAVSREILQIRQATGKSVSEITQALTGLYSNTNKSFRGALQQGGSTSLASAALLGGPQATAFLENFLGKNKFQRLGQEAQGFRNIVGANGQINYKGVEDITRQAKNRGLGDVQAGLTTMGLSDDEAKGFIRLADALRANKAVIEGARTSVVDLNSEYRKTMSLGDSFRASVNKVKGVFAPGISAISQKGTDLLGKASQSGLGAASVVAGGGILAAILTGGGLKGIGKGLIGGELRAKAIEGITGEKVQKVEVINWPAGMGIGEAAGGLAAGLLTAAGPAAAVVGTAAASIYAGTKLNDLYQSGVQNNTAGLGDLDKRMQNLFDRFYQMLPGHQVVEARVKVDMADRRLKAAAIPGRGGSN